MKLGQITMETIKCPMDLLGSFQKGQIIFSCFIYCTAEIMLLLMWEILVKQMNGRIYKKLAKVNLKCYKDIVKYQ